MLADYELLVGSNLNEALRSNGIEAATASVVVVDAYYCKVVVDACADTVVRTHRTLVDLCCALISFCLKLSFFLRGRLYDDSEFILLCLEIFGPD